MATRSKATTKPKSSRRSSSTDVVEYDESGNLISEDDGEDVEVTTWEAGDDVPETVTAVDPSGNAVEIALSDAHRGDLAYEGAATAETYEDVDFPGKEEDAELARQHHELGIDNQLTDDHLEARGV